MIFKSDNVKAHWDTWTYYHEETYYLYYLITERSAGEGFGVATSDDGVHWHYRGWAIRESERNLVFLGTGAVWKSPDFEQSGSGISRQPPPVASWCGAVCWKPILMTIS